MNVMFPEEMQSLIPLVLLARPKLCNQQKYKCKIIHGNWLVLIFLFKSVNLGVIDMGIIIGLDNELLLNRQKAVI